VVGGVARDDDVVIEPTEVWMVHLKTGAKPAEIRGTLSLGEDGLVFTDRKTDAQLVFGFATIDRVKRIRGSPVLLVDWLREGEKRRTAFYFSQPPPLEPLPGSTSTLDSVRGTLGPFGRTTPSKRQVARMNLGYLRSTSANSKKTVQAWVDAVNERARS
jgi:hypothetical protein